MGASIETTLELWAFSLRDAKSRMGGLFTQERVTVSAGLFMDGLPGDERRKTGWMRAEATGDPGPWRQQGILGRGWCNADGLRDIARDYVIEHLGTFDLADAQPNRQLPELSSGIARSDPLPPIAYTHACYPQSWTAPSLLRAAAILVTPAATERKKPN